MNKLGEYLKRAREAAGLSRGELAKQIGLDPSYIYRIELDARKPSREVTLKLGEILKVDGSELNRWLLAAAHAPMPLLSAARATVRTRGGSAYLRTQVDELAGSSATAWALNLESIGLREPVLARLSQATRSADFSERRQVAGTVVNALTHLSERLEAPISKAVIPAAGPQFVANHIMQRLLLRAITEATRAGISDITLVLTPPAVETLFKPLKEALGMMIVPQVNFRYVLQPRPEGLGDAVLRAEEAVGDEAFAVLLPDDVVRERVKPAVHESELRRMTDAFVNLGRAHMVATASIPKSKFSQYGVVLVDEQETYGVAPVLQLIEKPDSSHSISSPTCAFGIVGRYLLHPEVFQALRELQERGQRPLHLTAALDMLRQSGGNVYALELKAMRQDLGEILGQANELIDVSTDSRSFEN